MNKMISVLVILLICAGFAVNGEDHVYAIGDTGPGGGIIFYDKGSYTDGWRYMEAARKSLGRAVWGGYRYCMGGTGGDAIGTGRQNTINHVAHCKDKRFAAKLALEYRGGGKDDWFLPSKDELILLNETLFLTGFLPHENHHYWSSTSYSLHYAWNLASYDSRQYYWGKYGKYHVLPIRYF